jgi:protein SERAC1
LSFGYDVYGTNGVVEHASNLLFDLADVRVETPSRPIIFVAHSFGGLVCKRAVLSAQTQRRPDLRAIYRATKGIVFLGTPHQGSSTLARRLVPLLLSSSPSLRNKPLVHVLHPNDSLLQALHTDFMNMLHACPANEGRELQVSCFFEELPMPILGKVVSQSSATIPGYTARSIHGNHRDMVRFGTEGATGSRRIVAELRRWVQEIQLVLVPTQLM